jgi:integrase/recombinase XerD
MTIPDAVPFPVVVSAGADRLRLAIAAYLSRYKGQSRVHAESDLRSYLTWCLQRGVDPLVVSRPQVELYVRWMQEIRRTCLYIGLRQLRN